MSSFVNFPICCQDIDIVLGGNRVRDTKKADSLNLENTTHASSCFLKILIPYSRFLRIHQTDIEHLSARALFIILFEFQGSGFLEMHSRKAKIY